MNRILYGAVIGFLASYAIQSLNAAESSVRVPAEIEYTDTAVVLKRKIETSVDLEDGDSFWLGIHRLRLKDIDAPEVDQNCKIGSKGATCHTAALSLLKTLTADPNLRCVIQLGKEGKPKMSYGRYLATCWGGTNELNALSSLNLQMVQAGMALAGEKSDNKNIISAETEARKMRVGVHRVAELKHPAEHRRQNRDPKCSCE